MKRLLFLFAALVGMMECSHAQQEIYFNFKDLYPVKDYHVEMHNNKLSLVATDVEGNTDVSIQGQYQFVLNGFIEKIIFSNGVANISHKVEGTSFLYIKHENKTDEIYKLYFIVAGVVIPVPLWLIVVVPLLIIILAMVIRKFIVMGIILLIFLLLFLVFGLSFSSLFNLIAESASAIFK